jgi:mono/diheme cytochrome c family protein
MNTWLALLCSAVVGHASAAAPDGAALFQKNCAACHQANGQGIPGAFPALAANPLVAGPAGDVAAVLLKGRGGMPDFSASLSDGEIAAILSHARSSWGNQGSAVSVAEVASLRAALQAAQAGTGRLSNKH